MNRATYFEHGATLFFFSDVDWEVSRERKTSCAGVAALLCAEDDSLFMFFSDVSLEGNRGQRRRTTRYNHIVPPPSMQSQQDPAEVGNVYFICED